MSFDLQFSITLVIVCCFGMLVLQLFSVRIIGFKKAIGIRISYCSKEFTVYCGFLKGTAASVIYSVLILDLRLNWISIAFKNRKVVPTFY